MNKNVVVCDQCQMEAQMQGSILINQRQDVLSLPANWFHLSKKEVSGSIATLTQYKNWDFCSIKCLHRWLGQAQADAEAWVAAHQNERDAQLLREAAPHPLPSEQPQPSAPAPAPGSGFGPPRP